MKNLSKSFILSLLVASVLSGCTAKGFNTENYQQGAGESDEVVNRAIVDGHFNSIWDKLVKQLTESFFIVNNISKESRLINVSFSTNSPEDYVDCGTTTRTYKRGDEQKDYTYAVAADSSYKIAYDSVDSRFAVSVGDAYHVHAYNAYVNRKTDLEGRINIYMAPNTERQGTEIVTNIRYILTIQITGDIAQEAFSGRQLARWPIPDTKSIHAFNSNELYSSKDTHPFVCFSTGALERMILKMAE